MVEFRLGSRSRSSLGFRCGLGLETRWLWACLRVRSLVVVECAWGFLLSLAAWMRVFLLGLSWVLSDWVLSRGCSLMLVRMNWLFRSLLRWSLGCWRSLSRRSRSRRRSGLRLLFLWCRWSVVFRTRSWRTTFRVRMLSWWCWGLLLGLGVLAGRKLFRSMLTTLFVRRASVRDRRWRGWRSNVVVLLRGSLTLEAVHWGDDNVVVVDATINLVVSAVGVWSLLGVEVVRPTDRRVDIRRDSRGVEFGGVDISRGVVVIGSRERRDVKVRRTITGNVQSARTESFLLGLVMRLVEAVAQEITLLVVVAQEVVHARVAMVL